MVAVLCMENSMCSMLTVDGIAAIRSCRFGCESAYSWLLVARSISLFRATDWECISMRCGCVGGNVSCSGPSSISVSLCCS